MNTNYKSNNIAKWQRQIISAVCIGTFLFVTATFAQTPTLRANGKIAFTSDRDGNQEIYVMNNDGTGQIRLTNNPGVDSFPAFSPDGGKIAFDEGGEIFTINVDGSNRTNLTNHPAGDIEPSWSADGSRIVFISSRVSYLTMHTMNADGSDVRALPSADEFWDMSPDWSPTGNKIAFIVHSDIGLPVIYTANADGTNRQSFDGTGFGSTHRNKPKWSPDATKIVFHIWEFFSNDAEIYVKNVDGGGLIRLTNTNGNNFQPSWQPLTNGKSRKRIRFF